MRVLMFIGWLFSMPFPLWATNFDGLHSGIRFQGQSLSVVDTGEIEVSDRYYTFEELFGKSDEDLDNSRVIDRWLNHCDTQLESALSSCGSFIASIISSEKQEIKKGRVGYLCPPDLYNESNLIELINQHVQAKRGRLQHQLDQQKNLPEGAKLIGVILEVLIDIFPCSPEERRRLR